MDKDALWSKIRSQIKEQISNANFKTWFSQASLEVLEENRLTICVPSAFIKDQLILRYDELIKACAFNVLEKNIEITYLIDPSKALKKAEKLDKKFLEDDIFQINPPSFQPPTSPLNPKYSLENFVVGLTNNLAYAAAQAIVQNPGTSYNPLFIYGPSGVGKTHLMHGIGNALLSKNPYLKVIYAPSEKFMNDLVESIQNKKTGDFRQKYRYCDILLIDDIQFIAGKDSTQEEFFHTFNELYSKSSQIILTSDRPPTEMQKLESRLLSRFQGGLMVDIQLPDFDTRLAILKSKLLEKGESLNEEYLKLIAESVESNTRELEGKLIQFIQLTKFSHGQIDEATIQRTLGKPQTKTNSLDQKKILGGIQQYFNIKASDITGPRRQKELVIPRQIAMYLMYEECRIPMEKIGQILGGRDHTTVLHGIEKIRTSINRDRELQRLVIEVRQYILNG